MDPFLCVKETYGDDDFVSSHSSSKNETEVGMANFAFNAETNASFVEAALTTSSSFKECALRRRRCCRCFREDDAVLKEEVKESDDDDWVPLVIFLVELFSLEFSFSFSFFRNVRIPSKKNSVSHVSHHRLFQVGYTELLFFIFFFGRGGQEGEGDNCTPRGSPAFFFSENELVVTSLERVGVAS